HPDVVEHTVNRPARNHPRRTAGSATLPRTRHATHPALLPASWHRRRRVRHGATAERHGDGVTRSAEGGPRRLTDDARFQDAFAELGRLVHAGDSHGASEVAAGIAERAEDPGVVASALALQIGQLHNA